MASSIVLVLGVAGCSLLGAEDEPSPRGSGGGVTEAGDADVLAVRVGDCIATDQPAGSVSSVPLVPCDEAHDSEVYFVHTFADDAYPGDDAVAAIGEERCVAQFQEFVGLPYDESVLEVTTLEPTQQTWEDGDRELVCVVIDPAGGVTGSLEGAAR